MDKMRISRSQYLAMAQGTLPRWAPLLDRALLAKPADLQPIELRYLRRRVGWTAAEAAQALGVSSNVIVSRWESGVRRMPRPTERLFRLLAANALGIRTVPLLVEQFKSSWRWRNAKLEIHLYPERNRFEYRWAVPPRKLPRPIKRLFWDIDTAQLDLERQADYTINRVLEKGDLDDWNWLRWTYGEARIGAVLNQKRKVSPATAHLWKNTILARGKGR